MIYGFRGLWFCPDAAGGSGGRKDGDAKDADKTQKSDLGDQKSKEGKRLEFESWITGQPKEVAAMLDGHTAGLRSALESEREIRKGNEKNLRELAEKAEKGSESQKRLTEMADQIAEADKKADFYEEAHRAGVSNLKLAYIMASQDELFDKRGRVNFEAMKKDYPELFGREAGAAGNAGSGTGTRPPGKGDMNEFIRRSAGRVT
jgi:hypothetical protein